LLSSEVWAAYLLGDPVHIVIIVWL